MPGQPQEPQGGRKVAGFRRVSHLEIDGLAAPGADPLHQAGEARAAPAAGIGQVDGHFRMAPGQVIDEGGGVIEDAVPAGLGDDEEALELLHRYSGRKPPDWSAQSRA